MGFQGKKKWSGKKGKSKYTSVRLTGMFRTKKPGMYVGNARPEDVEALVKKIKEARAKDQNLVFFLFKNQDKDSDIAFSLLVDAKDDDRDSRKSKKSSRIEEDDDDAEGDSSEEEEEGSEEEEESEEDDL